MAHLLAKDLRGAVLQAAMQGKLTEQLNSDNYQALIPEVLCDSPPFEIPESWKWSTMGNVLSLLNGRAYKKDELLSQGKYKVLRVGNFFTNDKWYYSDLELEDKKYCDNGDLLYAWSASFGPRIWEGGKCIFHYHIWKVQFDKRIFDVRFLYYYLLFDVLNIKKYTTGSTMAHVSMENMKPRFIVVPPLEEQRRIVSRIDELMAKIDEYEKIENQLVELHKNFPSDMKAAVLQAAVQGKLTEQLNGDSNPYDLKLKFENAEESDLNLPSNWACIKYKELADSRMGKTILTKNLSDSGIPVYSATIEGLPLGYLNNVELELHENDIVIPARGNSIGHVKLIKDKVATCTQTTICSQNIKNIDPNYLLMACKAFKDKWFKYTGSAIPQITVAQVNNIVVPLPPIEEQQRIVEVLDRLLPICDSLQEMI